MELMENQINFLQEKCNSKSKLINSLLENLFHCESHQTKLHHNDNAVLPANTSTSDHHCFNVVDQR